MCKECMCKECMCKGFGLNELTETFQDWDLFF